MCVCVGGGGGGGGGIKPIDGGQGVECHSGDKNEQNEMGASCGTYGS